MQITRNTHTLDRLSTTTRRAIDRMGALSLQPAGPVYLWLKRAATATIPLFILLIIACLTLTKGERLFESAVLTFLINTTFVSLASLFAAYIAGRAFITTGILRLLLLGCGTLTAGLSWGLAGPLLNTPSGPNQAVTASNIGFLVAGLFHFAVAAWSTSGIVFEVRAGVRWRALAIAYLAICALTAAVVAAAVQNLFPPFFVQGVGPTPIRQAVLGTAVALFALSALALYAFYRRTRIEFHYWYALALALMAVGLTAVFFQSATGSLLNWTGRVAQNVGGAYFGAAVLLILRERSAKGIALDMQIAGLFREAEANFGALVEAAPDAIVVTDENAVVLLWNPAAERIFGFTAAEAVGARLADLVVAPESADSLRRRLDEAIRPGEVPFAGRTAELVARDKGGRPVPIEYTLSVRRRGTACVLTLILRDISERKQSEQVLETARAEALDEKNRLQAVMDALPVGVAIHDAGGGLIGANHSFEQIWRGPRPAIHSVGDYANFRAWWVDTGRPLKPEEWASVRAVQKGEPVVGQMLRIERFDGSHAEVVNSGVPTFDALGNITGSVVAVMDITEHRRAEVALRRQTQISAALEERQRLARELHDSVSQSLYGIALGTRTARALLGRDPGPLEEPLDFIISMAEMALSDMRALIFDLRPETLADEGLVAALAKRAAFVRQRQSIRVELDLCAEPDLPLAVKEGLYSIAREALHNVVKHAHAREVSIRLAQMSGDLVLEVLDNGAGFDPGAEYPGHLGLQSMRERAAYLGGALAVDSAPGRGTRVCVRIPYPHASTIVSGS